MSEIIPLLLCLQPILSQTMLRQLRHVAFAMMCNPKQATMLGLSRWSEKGGSYRTMQRLYHTPIAWVQVHWLVLKAHLLKSDGVYLLAGDEVVVSKAGKKTHGVGRFYSGLAQRAIPSVSFMTLSLIDVEHRQSYPLYVEQIMPVEKASEPEKPAPKRKRGRPKGRKNYEKPAPTLSPLLSLFQGMLGIIQGYLTSLRRAGWQIWQLSIDLGRARSSPSYHLQDAPRCRPLFSL